MPVVLNSAIEVKVCQIFKIFAQHSSDYSVENFSPETIAAKLRASTDCLSFQPADVQPHQPSSHGDSL